MILLPTVPPDVAKPAVGLVSRPLLKRKANCDLADWSKSPRTLKPSCVSLAWVGGSPGVGRHQVGLEHDAFSALGDGAHAAQEFDGGLNRRIGVAVLNLDDADDRSCRGRRGAQAGRQCSAGERRQKVSPGGIDEAHHGSPLPVYAGQGPDVSDKENSITVAALCRRVGVCLPFSCPGNGTGIGGNAGLWAGWAVGRSARNRCSLLLASDAVSAGAEVGQHFLRRSSAEAGW